MTQNRTPQHNFGSHRLIVQKKSNQIKRQTSKQKYKYQNIIRREKVIRALNNKKGINPFKPQMYELHYITHIN